MSDKQFVHVLMVEDNPAHAFVTGEALKFSHAPFRLVHRERLADALETLQSSPVDIVLLDLGLPDSQGLSGLLKMRAIRRHLPVVVMTARDDDELALQAVREGAEDYLVKGQVDGQNLRRALLHAIERSETRRALRERAALASLNADVGIAFSEGGPLDETLHRCADSMVRNIDAAVARIWTLRPGTNVLSLQASAGACAHPDEADQQIPLGQFTIGRIAAERQPLVTDDVAHDAAFSDGDSAVREGWSAFAGYPLIVEGRTVGVMAIFGRQPLSSVALEMMGSVANHIALGIERSRTAEAAYKLRAIVEGADDAIIGSKLDGEIVAWNPGATRIFGYTAEEAIGRRLSFLASPDQQDELHAVLETVRRGERTSLYETTRRRKDGNRVDVSVCVSPVRDGQGRVIAACKIVQDITERRRLEEQFRQAQKMDAVGRLAGGVAHDFNNLLTVILGCCELLEEDVSLADDSRDLAKEIQTAGSRAAALTQQLLAFSRQQLLQPEVLNLNDVIAAMSKMLGRLIGEDVVLTTRLSSDLWPVKVDQGQIEQVLLNLAVNARDAMPQGGKLVVETSNVELDDAYASANPETKPGFYVAVSVSDTGCGMDDETKARIFEPFFTTKGVRQGTGLGLATVFGVVKQSDGHITFHSELGEGTTFTVYLPKTEIDCESDSEEETRSSPTRGTETVLIVEDEDILRSLAVRILQSQGYTVLAAENGREALSICEQRRGSLDLLLTDVVMPEMSGRQLSERVRDRWPDVKVLFMSGYTDDAIVRHGVSAADTEYIQKPFTPTVLARKVRDVLDRPTCLLEARNQ